MLGANYIFIFLTFAFEQFENAMELLKSYFILILLAMILAMLVGYSTCVCIKWLKNKIQSVLFISDHSAYIMSISYVLLSYYISAPIAGILYLFFWLTIQLFEYRIEANETPLF